MNSNSYTWKALINGEFIVLKLDQTLEENGIKDESENFLRLGVDEDFNMPNIYIYYNDGDSSQWVESVPATTGYTGSAASIGRTIAMSIVFGG